MPQFDLFSFSTQVIWLFIILFTFYFTHSLKFLPLFAIVLKLRVKRKNLSIMERIKLSFYSLYLFFLAI